MKLILLSLAFLAALTAPVSSQAQYTAYVANIFGPNVTPIDIATNTAGTPIAVGTTPNRIAITPDGATAYVTNNGTDNVTPIDIATNTAGTPIAVGDGPRGIAITPDGATAYVTNSNDGTVTPIDIAINTAGTPIAVGTRPRYIAITPDGATAYVSDFDDDNVTPIDIATNIAGTPIAVGDSPRGIAITPDGTTAYVTNNGTNNVTPIDIATNTAGTPIAVGDGPRGIAITPDGATAYVTNSNDGTVTPIDIAINTAGTPIAVGDGPRGIAVTPDGATAYVTNLDDDNVTPIDIATNIAGTPIAVGDSPAGIAITPAPLQPAVTIACALNAANPAPLTIPAAGQAVFFDFDITNSSGGPYTAQFWLNTTGPVNLPEIGPITRLIGAGGISLTLRLKMTAAAPAGTWTRICDIGDAYPTSLSTSSFSFDKSALFAPGDVPVNGLMTEAEFRAEFEAALDAALAEQAAVATELPWEYGLEGSYPNPFNPSTTIRFGLPESAQVRLVVYDVLGRQVRVLLDGTREGGNHEVVFDAGDLPSGTYLYRLETSQGAFTRTMLLAM